MCNILSYPFESAGSLVLIIQAGRVVSVYFLNPYFKTGIGRLYFVMNEGHYFCIWQECKFLW